MPAPGHPADEDTHQEEQAAIKLGLGHGIDPL